MAHLVQFDSTKFDLAHESPNPINPIPGESVLRWLRDALGDGFTVSAPAAEDWGWYCDVTHAGAVYLLGASAEPNDDGSAHVMLQVHRHRSLKDRLTGANALQPDDPLTARIAALLRADPAVRNLEIEI